MYKLNRDVDSKKAVVIVDEMYREDLYRYIESKKDKRSRKKFMYRYFKDFYFLKLLFLHFNKYILLTTVSMTLITFAFSIFNYAVFFHISLFVGPLINVLTFLMTSNLNNRYSVLEYISMFKSCVIAQVCQLRDWHHTFKMDRKAIFKLHNCLYKIALHIIHYTQTVDIKKKHEIERLIYRENVLYSKYVEETYRVNYRLNVLLSFTLLRSLREIMRCFNYLKSIRDYRAPVIVRIFLFVSMFSTIVPISLVIVELTKDNNRQIRWIYATAVGFITGLIYGNLVSLITVMHDPFGVELDQVNMKDCLNWLRETIRDFENNEHDLILTKNKLFVDKYRSKQATSSDSHGVPNIQNHDFILSHLKKVRGAFTITKRLNSERAFELNKYFKVLLL